jgi:DNA replication regulator DPB11
MILVRSLQLDFASPTITPSEGDTRAAPPGPSRRRGPFIDDDFDDAPLVVNEAQQEPSTSAEPPELTELLAQPLKQPAQPLQPQSPNRANSPKKPLHSHNTTRDPSPEKQDTSSSTSGSDTAHLNESIAALLAQKQRSARQPSNPPPETNASRRKRGLLGRATSGSSLTSLSRTPSLAPVPQQPSERISYADEGEKQPQLPAPSQKIIYEDENLREERLKLIKRLGGNLVEEVEIQRGESIGVVKDRVASDSTTTRARRRR